MKDSIAYITDTHLEQRLTEKSINGATQMHYAVARGLYADHFITILEDVVKRGITDLVFGGDIGSLTAYSLFFQEIEKRKLHFHLVMGNHDDHFEIAHYLSGDHKRLGPEFFIEKADVKIIIMDTSSNKVIPQQLDWLKANLAVDKPILLFLHHPVLPVETPLDKTGASLKGKEQIAALLWDHTFPVTIVCGHYHMVDDRIEGNIRQLLSPAASYQICYEDENIRFDSSSFGYRILHTGSSAIQTELVVFTA